MKHIRFRRIAYRALSVLLVASMLGANLTTLSFASGWENRDSAIVLVPTVGTTLPTDAELKRTLNGRVATYRPKDGKFILPVGELENGMTGRMTLELLTNETVERETAHEFEVIWYASCSQAGGSPLNGDRLDNGTLTLTQNAAKHPAFSISGEESVVTDGELNVTLTYEDVANTTIELVVEWRGESGNYTSTGQSVSITGQDARASEALATPLSTNEPGNYRLRLTVVKNNDLLLETTHYFIVRASTANSGTNAPTTG